MDIVKEIKLRLNQDQLDRLDKIKTEENKKTYTKTIMSLIYRYDDYVTVTKERIIPVQGSVGYRTDYRVSCKAELEEAIKQLHAIGNNINQIARKCNALNKIPAKKYFDAFATGIRKEVDRIREVLGDDR